MREPPGATFGSASLILEGVRTASDAVSAGDTASGAAAARMEHVIDQFIWQDGDRGDRPETTASAPAFGAPVGQDGKDIVAKLAPRRLDGPEWLPRIVTSSLPTRPPALPGDDRWRLQFMGALHDADDGATMAPASPPPLAQHVRSAPARSLRDRPEVGPKYGQEYGRGGRQPRVLVEPSPFAARWRKARRVLAAAAITTCVFSTGVLWATHRSEMVAESGGQPAEIAAVTLDPIAAGEATPGQPIRNTPVLIREGETRTITSGLAAAGWRQGLPPTSSSMAPARAPAPNLPLIINGGESSQSVPAAPVVPIAPVVRTVPVVPITPVAPAAQAAAVVAPGPSIADAVTAASPLPPPPLDRDGLTDRAARPAESSAHASAPMAGAEPTRRDAKVDAQSRRRDPAGRRAHAAQVPSAPVQSRGAAPKVARGYVPAAAWEMRRQGLRTEPEPEPSMFKKLIGLVWPPGKSSTAAQPAEPAKPVAPAVTPRPYSWSDDARARP